MKLIFREHSILVLSTLTSFITPFISSAITVALPSIGKEFGLTSITLSWVASSFLLATAVLLIPVGKLTDIFGRTRFFRWGIFVFTLGSIFSAAAIGGLSLIAARVLQGIGGAMVFSTSIAILVASYPAQQRGKVLGISTAATYTGLSSGPFLGGIITQNFGWRYIFLLSAVLGVVSVVMAGIIFAKVKDETSDEKYDTRGAFLFTVTFFFLLFGFSKLPSLQGIVCTATGVLLFPLLFRLESRTPNPVFNFGLLLANRTFMYSNIAALINYSATFAVSFLLSLYLQYVRGYNPQSAGIILVMQPVMQAVFSPLAGKLSDRIEPRLVASVGMGLIIVGLIPLIFLSSLYSIAFLLCSLAVLGLGFALFSSPNTNAIMSSVEKNSYGVAASVLSAMRLIGQMLSMGIVMVIFTVFIGGARINGANISSLQVSITVAFAIYTLLCAGGIFASLARGRIHQGKM